MLTLLNLFLSSFSQLLSSPSFTVLANKSVLNALDHCDISSLPFGSQDDSTHSPSVAGEDERHLRHVELESSLRASLLKSSPPRQLTSLHSRWDTHSSFMPTLPVPANSPSLTPSNSFPDDSFTLASAGFPGAHSACPSFCPSASSTPTFDLALISDSSDCPDDEHEELHPSDSISISSDHDFKTPEGVGLGITGVRKHDGTGQFDGLGLVNIHRWIPRSARITHEANPYVVPFQLSDSLSQELRDQGDAEISDTLLQEAAMTFIQDPFHIHSLATIPECRSWSELVLVEGETCDPVSTGVGDEFETSSLSTSNKVSTLENETPLRRMKKHFSASTISSELKQTHVKGTYHGGRGMRTRSSTWPSHARLRLSQVTTGDDGLGAVN